MYRSIRESLLRAISRPRCALIHTFVFRLPRFYGNIRRTRLLIAARASSRSARSIKKIGRVCISPIITRRLVNWRSQSRRDAFVFNYHREHNNSRARKKRRGKKEEKKIISPPSKSLTFASCKSRSSITSLNYITRIVFHIYVIFHRGTGIAIYKIDTRRFDSSKPA